MVPYLDIHVFSAVLFIIVGVLLTHAIWFNWWSSADESETSQPVTQLTTELSRQRSLSDEHREAYEQLKGEYDTTQRDWLALRQENEHLKTRDQERQRAWANQDVGLRKLQEFKHEALIGLEQERHRRATAESGLRSAKTTIARLKSDLLASGRNSEATSESRQVHEPQQTDDRALERLQRERDETRQKHRDETRRREELEASIKAKERVIKQLAADSQSLKAMRAKQATFQTTREADAEQIKTLQEELQRLQNDNQSVLAQIRSLDKRLEAEQSAVRGHDKEKQDLAQKLNVQREKIFALEAALATNSQNAQELRAKSQVLGELQSQLETARTSLQGATDQLQRVTEDRDELQKTTESLYEQTRHGELRVKQLQVENEKLHKQHDEAIAMTVEYDASSRQLNEQIHALQASLDQIRQQRDDAGRSARAHRQRLTLLQAELGMTRERITSFDKQSQALHDLRAQQQGFQRSLQECASRLNLATEERDRKASELDRSHAENASLCSQLQQLEAKRNQEVHRTEQQLIALRQRRQLVSDHDNQEVAYSGRTRRDKQLGVLYTEEPEQNDDLKLVTGITEIVEQRLNDFGVYTYRQIMDWDSIAVEEFSRLLAVGDRIVSDDWMGQAKTLHSKYHDQAA